MARSAAEVQVQQDVVSGGASQPEDNRTAEGCQPSARSIRGLDGINFLMADVRDGVGPYLAVFLKGGEGWNSGAIGIAMAASSIETKAAEAPA